MRTAAAFLLALTCFAVRFFGQTIDYRYERFLLPIYAEPTHGAFGSLWVSELWIYNGTSRLAFVSPSLIADWGIFAGQVLNPSDSAVPKRPVGRPPGSYSLLAATEPRQVRFNLRIRDLSRQGGSWGTELPVIREEDFRQEKIVLLNIPAANSFRRTLRIYEPLAIGQGGGDVIIQLVGIPDNQLLWERQVTLQRDPRYAYAEIPLNAQFQGAERARIEIEPLYPWMRIWAFVSITSNETQQVTTVTPQ